jgi:(2S)-methylsuccinyl-CoA dehydrogenase
MSTGEMVQDKQPIVMEGLTATMRDALGALDTYAAAATSGARGQLAGEDGRPDRKAFERHQHLAHGLSWLVTYVETLRQVSEWAFRLEAEGKFGEVEALLSQILFSDYCAQIVGGIPMNQGETIRPHELGSLEASGALFAERSITEGKTPASMAAAAALLPDALTRNTVEETGLDETMSMVREQFAKYASDAHGWHLRNDYIPMDVVNEMAELGVFGLTIPEEYGGLGLGKRRCASSPKNCRGYIGVGSLGTRSEIAAELILCGGTDDEQKQKSGCRRSPAARSCRRPFSPNPTPGPTWPRLRTRAVKDGDTYTITGNKTWITHPVRADVMTCSPAPIPTSPVTRACPCSWPKSRAARRRPFPGRRHVRRRDRSARLSRHEGI